MKTFYVLLDGDNFIRDVIEYEHDGYAEVELPFPLPVGINGGWWKLENGQLVEYPELKPKDSTEIEIEQVKELLADLTEIVLLGGAE